MGAPKTSRPASAEDEPASAPRPSLPAGTAGRWIVFCLSASLFILSQFYRVSNAVIAPELQLELNLSPEELGLLSAAFFYAFALAQVPLGLLIDRVGARRAMTALTVIGAAGAGIFATAETLAAAVTGRLLLGFGMAGNLMGPMKLFTQWFSPREFATLSGLILALGTLGNMLAATPLALASNRLGWRWSFGALGIVTAAAAAVFFLVVRERPDGPEAPPAPLRPASPLRNAARLLSNRDYWIISFSAFFRYGTLVAIQGLWAGPYMIQGLGLSAVEAGNFLLLLNMGLVIGSPLGGWLSDRVLGTRKGVILLGLAVMGLAELGLALGWGEAHLWVLAALFFFLGMFGSFGIVMYAHIKERMPNDMTGMALTGVNLFTMLGGAALLQGMGWVVERWAHAEALGTAQYERAFLACAAGVALALVLYTFTRESPAREG